MWVDSHIHLEDEAYDPDRDAVLARAKAAGVDCWVNAGSTQAANRAMLKWLPQEPAAVGAIGLHPHEFATDPEAAVFADVPTQLSQEKIVALGEIGLDYHVFKDFPAPNQGAQQAAFRHQLRLARIFELPLIVHVREAYDDALRILKEEGPFPWGGVLHCYAGGPELLPAILDLGFYVGIGGPVTYPSGEAIRRVVEQAPFERLLLETDAPYLPPQSRRGQRNEPALLPEIGAAVALARGCSRDEVAAQTTANAQRLFRLGASTNDVRVYPIQNHLYVNLTNRCSANCVFCPRRVSRQLHAYDLTLAREATAAEILSDMGDARRYAEVVFCGFGEPVLRLPTLLAVAREVKKQGVRVRVNTNGHADLIYGRDILPECVGVVDEWSVSLNSADPEQYDRLVQPASGPHALESVKAFVARAVQAGFSVTTTAVEMPAVDVRAVAELSRQLGARYRGRIPQRLGEPEN